MVKKERSSLQDSAVNQSDKQGGCVTAGRKSCEESDLKVESEAAAAKNDLGLLTRTIPTSFITRTTQERREALMGKITRQHYGMEE